jgi:hypothetical protein
MNKIIIENGTDLTMLEVLPFVAYVMEKGRVSNNNTQYAYVTIWENGIVLSCDRNEKSDRFILYREGEYEIK